MRLIAHRTSKLAQSLVIPSAVPCVALSSVLRKTVGFSARSSICSRRPFPSLPWTPMWFSSFSLQTNSLAAHYKKISWSLVLWHLVLRATFACSLSAGSCARRVVSLSPLAATFALSSGTSCHKTKIVLFGAVARKGLDRGLLVRLGHYPSG